jgi:pimeloyl-ACP methyl ester carboxylesterase
MQSQLSDQEVSDRREPARLETRSPDGTPIAYWRTGSGDPLVLVHGATADHSRWEAVLPLLEDHVSVYAMDRRGRGGSGDASSPYTIQREGEDVAAVADAVAAQTGRPVTVLGHSYGGLCALEAAVLTTRMSGLVLYEAGAGVPTPPGFTARVAGLLDAGRREDVVIAVLQDLAGLTLEQIGSMKEQSSWAGRVAAAHTVVRELRAHDAYDLQPDRFRGTTVPTLLLVGSDSPQAEKESTERVAAALPRAAVKTMAGQGHVAMLTGPGVFADEVLGFLRPGTPLTQGD